MELGGYGSGSGSGSGYGSGYGSGDGDGDGSGSGYGYGDGYGDGDVLLLANAFGAVYPMVDVRYAFWRSTKEGLPANHVTNDFLPAKVGDLQSVEGPLVPCTKKALHGTLNPFRWRGEHWWLVALHEPVIRQDDKLASLKRTILQDLGPCPFL